MTALAGVWRTAGTDAGDRCREMLAAQAMYGGGDPRLWDGGEVAVGRDLRITLSEDAHDRQPLSHGPVNLVADVRLDDRETLATALDIEAAEATALSDADLVLRAWLRWGEEALERLYGDWALAVWDSKARRLMLARDGLGGRPLHHCRTAQGVAFASMPKGLHALPDMPRVADEERVAEFLALFPETGPRSFFAGVERVEPGCVVTLTLEGATMRRHWTPARGGRSGPRIDVVEAMRAHLDQAVRSRLRNAESGVATHLSAGLDSTAVTTTAARLLAPAGGRVLALTAVPRPGWSGREPPGRLSDEGPVAALTAASHPNIDHLRLPASGGLLERLDEDTDLHDRPLFNLCNQHWWSTIAEAASRREARVLLTGELGNATLSWAGMEVFPELMRQGRWGEAWRLGRAWVASGAVGPRAAIATVLAPWIPGAIWGALRRLRSGPDAMLRHSALDPGRAASMNLPSRARRAGLDLHYRLRRDGFESRLWHIGWIDPGVFRKAALAAWGLDVRDPTADRRLVEFCLTLPAEAFFLDGRPRELARRVLADRAPAEVLADARRGHQAADWAETLTAARADVGRVLATAELARGAGMLDLARLRRLTDRWPEGGEWDNPETSGDYRQALLRGLSALAFLSRVKGDLQKSRSRIG